MLFLRGDNQQLYRKVTLIYAEKNNVYMYRGITLTYIEMFPANLKHTWRSLLVTQGGNPCMYRDGTVTCARG